MWLLIEVPSNCLFGKLFALQNCACNFLRSASRDSCARKNSPESTSRDSSCAGPVKLVTHMQVLT